VILKLYFTRVFEVYSIAQFHRFMF